MASKAHLLKHLNEVESDLFVESHGSGLHNIVALALVHDVRPTHQFAVLPVHFRALERL